MTVQALRPYADLSGIFKILEYRPNVAAKFRELPLNGDGVNHVVEMNDLRVIPRHEFKITLDHGRLTPHYERHCSDLLLVVLTRDSMLRSEVVLARHALDKIPDVIGISPEDLRKTGHRDRLPLEFVIVAVPVIRGAKALPIQKASRLAQLHVTLANASGGASFPYRRATVEEFEERGLPAETGVHIELLGGAEELIKDTDTPPHSVFQVWINEKLWEAMQNDRSRSSAPLRMLAVTEMTATLLLSAAIPALKTGGQIEEGSIVGQVLGFVAKQTRSDSAGLRARLRDDLSLHEIAPFVQAAFRFATIACKADEDEEGA